MSHPATPWLLRTPRLGLRELVPDDLGFLAEMLGHPEVSFYYDRQFTRRDAEVWLERQLARYREYGHGLWLVSELASGTPLGQVGLAWQTVEDERFPEIGWLLHRPYWGRGYATEAAAAVRDWAFTRGHAEVISLIRPVNLPSQRVARRIGMQPGRHVEFHGYEHVVFSVARPDAGATAPAAPGTG